MQTLYSPDERLEVANDVTDRTRLDIRELFRQNVCPSINYFVAHYLAMPSTSCDVERMFGACGRQYDGRESLSVEMLEAEVRVVDFVRSECDTPAAFGEACSRLAQSVWNARLARKQAQEVENLEEEEEEEN